MTPYITHTNHSYQGYLTVDLHGLNRWKARSVLFNSLIKLLAKGKHHLLVIHGYHHGTVLRDYIRNGKLMIDLHREFPLLPDIRVQRTQKGATNISFTKGEKKWAI